MTAPGHVASAAQGEAANVAGTAIDEAGNVASTAAGAAADVAGTAKQEAGNVLGETVEQAKNLTTQVKEQASQQISTGSEKLTGGLRGLSEQLANGDTSGVVGQVLSEAGTRVQSLADHLERVGPQGLVTELRDYARRSPGTFLVGMAFAGFATGRVVKGLSAGKQQQALPPTTSPPVGTAAGAPLAGIAEPGIGETAGYATSPYPDTSYADTSYAPVDPVPAAAPYTPSGSTAPTGGYLSGSPLPGSTDSRGAL